MCKFKARMLKKGSLSEMRASVKEGCVVERPELSGNYMQVFAVDGNILKRTFRKDTQQWGSMSLCRSLNWMGGKEWLVIQDENGKDLRFGGDMSSFKVLPPFLMRDCEYEHPEEEPAEKAEPEPEPEPQAEEPVHLELHPAEKVSVIMQAVHKVAKKHGMPDRDVMAELTEIQKTHQFKDIDEAIAQFEKDREEMAQVRREVAEKAGAGIEALLTGSQMRVGDTQFRMIDNILYECGPGHTEFTESKRSFNEVLTAKWSNDSYSLSFDEAVSEMEKGRQCIPENMNVRFMMKGGFIKRADSTRNDGFPVSTIKSMWRVCGE